ncbi:LacI family transcriptional regulator [Balneicella halophila]|uniref:LacI family transcriptional regulator n=1 Tax=Balneicella halophila TaxID=1537566 RepID=A0A7L4UT94_BALHA|nr:LacI family DNA-binding transcriptional regulator [Balneicella halophila]PVX52304.1 LacI family transcriptional regulator [Balneicella halophila]
MNKRVTIKDIAKALDVSISTVSRALKDSPEISPKTRELIKKTAKDMKYHPNPIAVALKTSKSHTIGVIVPKIVNTFYAGVVEGIEEIADKHGYQVFVSSTNEDYQKEVKHVNAFINSRADGVILSLSRGTTVLDHIQHLQDLEIPTVLFDRTTKNLKIPRVVTDDAKAAYKAVMHLINGGAKNIAMLSGPKHLLIGRNRTRGYQEALEKAGLTFNPDLVIHSDFTIDNAQKATKSLLENEDVDAIFCLNDDLAVGAIYAAKELGLNVPEDVAVVGFYNSKRSHYMNPSISTVDLNPHELGVLAAGLLFEHITSGEVDNEKEIVVPSNLIIRESSKR